MTTSPHEVVINVHACNFRKICFARVQLLSLDVEGSL